MSKTLGQMTPEERRAVIAEAGRKLQAELTAMAPHITKLLEDCECMTEDLGDGYGERVVIHSSRCHLHPDAETTLDA